MDSMTLEVLRQPEDWLCRNEMRKFVNMTGSPDLFNKYMSEIEALEDSHLYIYGVTKNDMKYHKIRVADYFNLKRRKFDRQKRKGA